MRTGIFRRCVFVVCRGCGRSGCPADEDQQHRQAQKLSRAGPVILIGDPPLAEMAKGFLEKINLYLAHNVDWSLDPPRGVQWG